ncbi:phospholipase D-like domain-containing protein [Geotoga petraea]|nr:phospholipase D-like domain-containing protein [Geotoga petraea]
MNLQKTMNKLKYSFLLINLISIISFSYEVFSNGEYFKIFLENKIKLSKEIKIVTYSMDDTLTNILVDKNHHIILDPSANRSKKDLNIQNVTAPNTGIQHEKFYIFDNKEVLFGTGNMTFSGILGDKNIYIFTEDKAITNIFLKEFDNLATQKYKKSLSKKIKDSELGSFEFHSTPNESIYKVIQKEIKNAKVNIDVFAFSLTDPFLVYELEKASSRGIEVNLYFDDWNEYYSDAVKNLKGINKYSYSDLHAKVLIIDNKRIILGSYNYTYKARNTNYELFTIIENKTISDIIKRFLIEED